MIDRAGVDSHSDLMAVRRDWLVLPALIGMLVACSGPDTAPPPDEPVAERPVLGAFHELLPDPAGDGVLLLTGPPEGVASGEPLELWRWDGEAWSTVPTAGPTPPARNFFAAAYDDQRDVVLLYGGDLPAADSATMWEWDGAAWAAFESAGPGPRGAAAMSFDSGAGHAVVYGGDDGRGTILNDTWAWDGRTWTRIDRPWSVTAALSRGDGDAAGRRHGPARWPPGGRRGAAARARRHLGAR